MRPLNEREIYQLAHKRRNKAIHSYFSFCYSGAIVNREFKRRMNPDGELYPINEDVSTFPATAAALLKYKKHEWVIIGFERHKKVILMWINKGLDRKHACVGLPDPIILKIALENNITTVLLFHNHPNPDPHYLICSAPSDSDIRSAKRLANVLNQNNINLVEFVCERGVAYKFFLSPTSTFYPLYMFIDDIKSVNNKSVFKNLSLHYERHFG